jgi:hypothetical protein
MHPRDQPDTLGMKARYDLVGVSFKAASDAAKTSKVYTIHSFMRANTTAAGWLSRPDRGRC